MQNRDDLIQLVQGLSNLSAEQRQAMLDEFQNMDDEQIATVLEYMQAQPGQQAQLQQQASDTLTRHVQDAKQQRQTLTEKYIHKALAEVERLKKNET